jgi:hypothetical protein
MALEMNIVHKLSVYAQPISLRTPFFFFLVYDYVHAAIAQLSVRDALPLD